MFSKVYVEISNVCNMSCSFCHGHNRAPYFMTESEFEVILNKLQNKTKFLYYHLMGEQLLHPLLSCFIAKAIEEGYKSIITTNGTLLSEVGDKLIDLRVHKVNISVHSFEGDVNDKLYKYLDDIICFSKKASLNGIIVVLRFWNNGAEGVDNNPAILYLRENLCGEWAENTKGYRIKEKLFLEFADRFVWPDKDAAYQSECVFCYGLRDHFGVLCDGTVVPCCLDSDGVISLGNIFAEDIDDILNSERAMNIKNGFSRRKAVEDLCRRCSYAQRF